jgi:hypothetical protein
MPVKLMLCREATVACRAHIRRDGSFSEASELPLATKEPPVGRFFYFVHGLV